MTNSELKFVAKVFSRMCTKSSHCVYNLYSWGCFDDKGWYGDDIYDLLKDSFYKGEIDDCPIKNTEIGCVDCSEKVWYEFLKQMDKKYRREND